MEDFVSNFNRTANNFLDPLNSGPMKGILYLVLVLYGGLAAPSMPKSIAKYYDNIVVRVLFLALLVWISGHDPAIALMCAVIFIVTLNVAGHKGAFDRFEGFEDPGPVTSVYPGCQNMSMFDLLASFNNDKNALINALQEARVPGDLHLSDANAPLLSTYLLSRGFVLKGPGASNTCRPPGYNESIGF